MTVTINIGGEERQLRFRTAEMVALEERLNSDVLAFLSEGRGTTRFLTEAVFVGLSHADKKLTPSKVRGWFDAYEGDRVALLRDILYAIARGRPAKEAEDMVKALDEQFYPEGKRPLGSGSVETTSGTT